MLHECSIQIDESGSWLIRIYMGQKLMHMTTLNGIIISKC